MPRKRHTVRNIILLTLLAAVCIGACELVFCWIADPPLFLRITAPAREAYAEARVGIRIVREAVQSDARAARGSLSNHRRQRMTRAAERAAQAMLLAEEQRALIEAEQQDASAPIKYRIAVADPTITELTVEDGQEYLTGGNLRLPYYNQTDEAWADRRFGRDPIGRYGCGPTALAMLVSGMTGEAVTPAELASWAAKAGYAAPKSGSYLSIVEGAAAHYGLTCRPLPVGDAESLCRELSAGGAVVALMGPGHFTGRGHFILLHGVTLTGEILVADPNSRDNSIVPWDAETILDELSKSRHDGAPLWLFPQDGQLS